MCLIPKKIWQKKKVLFGIKIIRHGLFPIIKDINLFSQWIDTDKVSIIAKAPFWIGVTQKTCWKVWRYD